MERSFSKSLISLLITSGVIFGIVKITILNLQLFKLLSGSRSLVHDRSEKKMLNLPLYKHKGKRPKGLYSRTFYIGYVIERVTVRESYPF